MAVAVKKYNPGFLTDDQIIASFCVRTAEFESLVESLRESDASSSPHSLVIGPRGSGKTHLLLRVAAEVRRNPALTGLFPIVFAEESYEVTTCGEFWLECLGRLAEQAPNEERDNLRLTYEELRTVTDDQALADRCIGSLLDFADRHETRQVLIVENLNMLFSDIGDPGIGWRLRQTLQTERRLIIFGSATSRFDEIDNPEHALYDIFRIINLHPLDTAECEALWQTVADKSSAGEAVRPLEILTGGNPRLLTIIAGFGAGRSFRDLMENLLDLIDEHTEYFKSHLEALPPQERRVYLALARLWKPSTTREVADLSRLSTNACSSQLKRLVGRGAVTIEGGTPRRRQYYLTERLYNIYYLLRTRGHSARLVRALIDFIVCLYSPKELVAAIQAIYEDCRDLEIKSPDLSEQITDAVICEAEALEDTGRIDEAIALYDQVVFRLVPHEGLRRDSQLAIVLLNKSILLSLTDRERTAIAICDNLIELFGSRTEEFLAAHVAMAFGSKGVAMAGLGCWIDALSNFDEALVRLKLMGDSMPIAVPAMITQVKGTVLLSFNQTDEALACFDQVLMMYARAGEPQRPGRIASALVCKSDALDRIGQTIDQHAFSLLLNCLADEESLLPGSIEALVRFISTVEPSEALDLLRSSPAAPLMAPLIAAVQQELGQTPQVAKEVDEVARDVRRRLDEARARRLQAATPCTAS